MVPTDITSNISSVPVFYPDPQTLGGGGFPPKMYLDKTLVVC